MSSSMRLVVYVGECDFVFAAMGTIDWIVKNWNSVRICSNIYIYIYIVTNQKTYHLLKIWSMWWWMVCWKYLEFSKFSLPMHLCAWQAARALFTFECSRSFHRRFRIRSQIPVFFFFFFLDLEWTLKKCWYHGWSTLVTFAEWIIGVVHVKILWQYETY